MATFLEKFHSIHYDDKFRAGATPFVLILKKKGQSTQILCHVYALCYVNKNINSRSYCEEVAYITID